MVLLGLGGGVLAEGSKEFMPASTSYGCIQFNDVGRPFALTTNTDSLHRLFFHISDVSEKVYFGFKRHTSSTAVSGSFQLKDPSANIVYPLTAIPASGAGYISSYSQAVAGPVIGGVPAGGYTPLTYTPVATGDFYIEFSSNANSNYRFEFFDLTVTDAAGTVIPGRLWSYAWDMNTWASANGFNGSFYVYTSEGYVSKVDMDGIQAYGFVVSCNNTGPLNTGNIVNDRKSISGNSTLPLFKVFINNPDISVYASASPPNLNNPVSVVGGAIYYGSPVQFSADVTGSGTIQLIISINGVSGYQAGTSDLIVAANVVTGSNIINWDGKDAFGVYPGSGTQIEVSTGFSAGDTHLPIYDPETHANGFIVNRIRPITGAAPIRWDDSNFGGGTVNISGGSGNGHAWALNFGDVRTMNTWWNGYEIENISAFTIIVQAPMPVELVSFTGEQSGRIVNLAWSTASEKNNHCYSVERSADGIVFCAIGRVMGAGNSDHNRSYSFADTYPFRGYNYYRLRQVDYNGKENLSSVISVSYRVPGGSFTIFPNPSVKGNPLYLRLTECGEREILVLVQDNLGRELYATVIAVNNNEVIEAVDPEGKLLPGIYFVTASAKEMLFRQKIVVR